MHNEGYKGLGKKARRDMIKRWREEGKPKGLSLKQWAAQTGVGDAADVWLHAKRTQGTSDPSSLTRLTEFTG